MKLEGRFRPNLASNPAGLSYPPTLHKPLPLPSKTLYPWWGSRVELNKGQGRSAVTPGLPLPITKQDTKGMSQICYYNFILTIVFFRSETTRQTNPATSTSPSTIKTLEQTIAYLSSILIITTSPCSTTTAPAGKMTTMTPTATTNDDNNARLVNRPFSPTTKCVRLGGGDKNRPKRGCTPRLGPRYVFSFMSSFFIIK